MFATAGNSNQSVEAAREAGMAAVVVAGRVPVYELTAADLVVRQLDELSFVNLKQLFRNEELAALNVRTIPWPCSLVQTAVAVFTSACLHGLLRCQDQVLILVSCRVRLSYCYDCATVASWYTEEHPCTGI